MPLAYIIMDYCSWRFGQSAVNSEEMTNVCTRESLWKEKRKERRKFIIASLLMNAGIRIADVGCIRVWRVKS